MKAVSRNVKNESWTCFCDGQAVWIGLRRSLDVRPQIPSVMCRELQAPVGGVPLPLNLAVSPVIKAGIQLLTAGGAYCRFPSKRLHTPFPRHPDHLDPRSQRSTLWALGSTAPQPLARRAPRSPSRIAASVPQTCLCHTLLHQVRLYLSRSEIWPVL